MKVSQGAAFLRMYFFDQSTDLGIAREVLCLWMVSGMCEAYLEPDTLCFDVVPFGASNHPKQVLFGPVTAIYPQVRLKRKVINLNKKFIV